MHPSLSLLAFVLSLLAFTSAQRITGDSACVNACYNISLSVTQCPDLTDNGVINCICTNTDQVSLLNTCQMCITTLTGVTQYEQNSINTLWTACNANNTVNGTVASATASGATASATSALGSNNAGSSADVNAAKTGSAIHSVASCMTIPLVAALVGLAMYSV